MPRSLIVLPLLLLTASIASAQLHNPRGSNDRTTAVLTAAPSVPVDCSLLSLAQRAGLLCAPPPSEANVTPYTGAPIAPSGAGTWADADCQGLNPYIEADAIRLVACNNRPAPADLTPSFVVGGVYSYGYSEIRAVILGVCRDTDGIQVVTLRWLQDGQSIAAVRTPPTPGGLTQWTRVGGAQ